ncbi:hypothetical protein [Thalassobellus citreus]|uniref:hypothetical protein n=1 Tax=Thalassobellus citreus TaxID=3367752 RepID=UPI0037ACF091
MEEFLKENYSLLTHVFEAIAAITGLLLFKKYKFTVVKYFIYFLVYLTICDLANQYNRYVHPDMFLSFLVGTVFKKNFWWCTLYWDIGAILFFVFYFNRILKKESFKKIISISGLVFFVFSIGCIIINWDDFFIKFFTSIVVFGALIIILCCMFYFVEILQSDKVLTFYKSMNFYITTGIFIWWLIITPIVFYDVYYVYDSLKNIYIDWDFTMLRQQIYLFSNILMYSTFTFALIWCRPQND